MKILDKYIIVLTTIIFSLFSILKLSDSGFIVLALLILILFLLGIERNKKAEFISKNPFFKILIIFVSVGLLSNFWTVDKKLTWEASFSLLRSWIFMNVIWCSLSHQKVENLLKCIMWGGTIFIIYIVLTIGITDLILMSRLEERVGGELVNANMLGMMGAIVTVISFSYLLYNGLSYDCIATFLGITIVFLTGSRKAFVMMIVGVFLIYLFKNRTKDIFQTFLKIAGGAIVATALVYFLFTLPMFSLLADRFTELSAFVSNSNELTNSDWERKVLIEEGWDQFLKQPITGIGLDCGRLLADKIVGHTFYLHNNYVELLVDVGIFGFLSYYFIYFYFGKEMIRLYDYWTPSSKLAATIMIMYLLADWGYVSYYQKETLFVIMICFRVMAETKVSTKNLARNKKIDLSTL